MSSNEPTDERMSSANSRDETMPLPNFAHKDWTLPNLQQRCRDGGIDFSAKDHKATLQARLTFDHFDLPPTKDTLIEVGNWWGLSKADLVILAQKIGATFDAAATKYAGIEALFNHRFSTSYMDVDDDSSNEQQAPGSRAHEAIQNTGSGSSKNLGIGDKGHRVEGNGSGGIDAGGIDFRTTSVGGHQVEENGSGGIDAGGIDSGTTGVGRHQVEGNGSGGIDAGGIDSKRTDDGGNGGEKKQDESHPANQKDKDKISRGKEGLGEKTPSTTGVMDPYSTAPRHASSVAPDPPTVSKPLRPMMKLKTFAPQQTSLNGIFGQLPTSSAVNVVNLPNRSPAGFTSTGFGTPAHHPQSGSLFSSNSPLPSASNQGSTSASDPPSKLAGPIPSIAPSPNSTSRLTNPINQSAGGTLHQVPGNISQPILAPQQQSQSSSSIPTVQSRSAVFSSTTSTPQVMQPSPGSQATSKPAPKSNLTSDMLDLLTQLANDQMNNHHKVQSQTKLLIHLAENLRKSSVSLKPIDSIENDMKGILHDEGLISTRFKDQRAAVLKAKLEFDAAQNNVKAAQQHNDKSRVDELKIRNQLAILSQILSDSEKTVRVAKAASESAYATLVNADKELDQTRQERDAVLQKKQHILAQVLDHHQGLFG